MTDITTKPDHGTPIGVFKGESINLEDSYQIFFDELEQKLNQFLLGSTGIRLPSYAKASLPDVPSTAEPSMIYVTDDVGGAVPAFSDGTNWRRVTDRNIIS